MAARFIFRRRFLNVRSVNVELLAEYLYHLNLGPPSGESALPLLLAAGASARRALGPRLLSLSVPVGFIYGENDWMDQQAGERVVADLYGEEEIPNYVRVVPVAGHQLMLENPSSFVLAVIELVRVLQKSIKPTVIHSDRSEPILT